MRVLNRPCVTSGRRACISVHPHLFRHTLAQGVLETTGNIKVAQEILGHSHLSTTADLYVRVDQHAMVTALAAAKSSTERATRQQSWFSAKAAQYAFEYAHETISELERCIAQLRRELQFHQRSRMRCPPDGCSLLSLLQPGRNWIALSSSVWKRYSRCDYERLRKGRAIWFLRSIVPALRFGNFGPMIPNPCTP
jgi:hypothetical protein